MLDIIKEIAKSFLGEDPKEEAKGNMAVINCTILFITCLLNKRSFCEYKGIFTGTFSRKIIYAAAVFIIIYTLCYSICMILQLKNLQKFYTNNTVAAEGRKIGTERLIENYLKPLKEMLNLFSCISIIYLSYLEITGTRILNVITNNNILTIAIELIALLILLINICITIKQFVWRTITGYTAS